jgi:SAM-dependent methyltransferase
MRERATVFGEVADLYEEVRPGYPDALVREILAYAGPGVTEAVEVGAGTGKGTEAFVRAGVAVRCVETDGRMAAVLRSRFAEPAVRVAVGRFEDWPPPPGGVRLLYCAQAWHWMDAERRCRLAYEALAPGGTLAVFAHTYGWADPAMEAAVTGLLRVHAVDLVREPLFTGPPEEHWLTRDVAGSGLFADVRATRFVRHVDYSAADYIRLTRTFSPVRRLPREVRAELLPALRETIDAAGGVVAVRLDTVLALARRPA